MAAKVFEWAIGRWEDRDELTYVPVDQMIGGSRYCCDLPAGASPGNEFPYKMEDTGEGVYYYTFSSRETAAIIRVREVE